MLCTRRSARERATALALSTAAFAFFWYGRNMVQLRSMVDDYAGALKKQRGRLERSRWLRDLAEKTDARCSICGGAYNHANDELDALCDALASVEADTRPSPLIDSSDAWNRR